MRAYLCVCAERPGFDSPEWQGCFSRHRVQTGSGAHTASYPVGTCGSFPEVKQQGRGADHCLQSVAEVYNVWTYTSIRPIRLHAASPLPIPCVYVCVCVSTFLTVWIFLV